MAKELWGNYFQFPRIFWLRTEKGNARGEFTLCGHGHGLSVNAKWLFVTLKELENAFTGRENSIERIIYEGVKDPKNWFHYDNVRLAEQAGMSVSAVKRAKKELVKSGLITTCKVYFVDEYGRKSLHYTSGYVIHDVWEMEKYRKT